MDVDTSRSDREHAHVPSARERLLSLLLASNRVGERDGYDIPTRGNWQGPLPASFAQERLWFLDQLGLVGSAYTMSMAVRLTGILNSIALERALAELQRRHEALRTRFAFRDGKLYQVIDSSPEHFDLHREDLSLVADRAARELKLQQHIRREQLHRFSLSEGPLWRVVLVKLDQIEHALLLTLHHVVSDGWSSGVLARELSALYAACIRGEPNPLPPLPVQYADYAIWQRGYLEGGALQEQLKYWRELLADAPTQIQLPTDRPRPAVESFKGAMVSFELSATLYSALKDLGRREGATLFMVMLAAYQVLLSRWSGQRDIVIGAPVAGRRSSELEGLIGFFVNTLVLRGDVQGDLTFRRLLERAKEMTLGAFAHQDLPFDELVRELRPDRNLARQPIFQVTLALQNVPRVNPVMPELTWTSIPSEWVTTHFDLTLYLHEQASRLVGTFEYATDLFDRITVERMAENLRTLLEGIVSNPNATVWQLPLLTAGERQRSLVEWNQTQVEIPRDKCLHELLSEQAQLTPHSRALMHGDRQLTYGELDARANQFAHYLRGLGVGPEAVVGICVDRSPELIIALVGVLKAGGAYLPLDPAYPTERLRFMLDDARSRLLITDRACSEMWRDHPAARVVLESAWTHVERQPTSVPDSQCTAANLAYVIYTSGSTGIPKAVAMPHEALCNHLSWMRARFALSSHDAVLQKTPVSFDASVWEIFAPLICGARLVLADPQGHKDPSYLCHVVRENGITVLQLVPSMLQLVSAEPEFAQCRSLRQLCSGGELLSTELRDRVFRTLDVQLHNLYGPTETCIQAVVYTSVPGDTKGTSGVPIGRPVWNTQVYVLDTWMQPVPIGVAGELYIGGSQLARGYLHRPGLTAERFVANPFGPVGTRLYRTGDLVRYLPDGNLEFLGRVDDQVKIRGYRVEPAELESVLNQHPAVKQAVVTTHMEPCTDQRLVAYVVGDARSAGTLDSVQDLQGLRKAAVDEWATLYEQTYAAADQVTGPSFVGWISSYDGQPLPEEQMKEWLAGTIERIKALRPSRVLEIGCGVGLLVQHLAPECAEYVATDFSASALAQLRQWTSKRGDLKHLRLLQRGATELGDLQVASFDTIVLNSVVQYFPSIDYLVDVLKGAIQLLKPGGMIFIGDVRDLRSLPMFHASVQLSKAAASVSTGELQRRIARAVARDKELVIDPEFFMALTQRLLGVGRVDVYLKPGASDNELTCYRYDVVLRTGERPEREILCSSVNWRAHVGCVAEYEAAIRERRWSAVRLLGIPNQRLSRHAAAQRLIEAAENHVEVSAIRRQLNERHFDDPNPVALLAFAQSHGYQGIAAPGEDGCFELQLIDATQGEDFFPVRTTRVDRLWTEYANNPLENTFSQQLVPLLRDYVRGKLPDYMMPSAWVVLKDLPVTPSGKVDRRALPPPQHRPEEAGDYVAPQTEVERILAEAWVQLLQVDQVGVLDNFFELGGHSLLAMKLIARIQELFAVRMGAVTVFQHPTVREMAQLVDAERTARSASGGTAAVEFEEGVL